MDAPKTQRWWEKGGKGKRKKYRATLDWLRKLQPNFVSMGENDFWQPSMPESVAPSSTFRAYAPRYQLIRYFAFLLQMVITLVRVWKPTRKQVKHYGLGVDSPQRRALLMVHSGELPLESVVQLRSVQRHLWGRISEEAEDSSSIENMCKLENESDQQMNALFKLQAHVVEVMLPGITAGRWPRVAVDVDPMTQYRECWKDRVCGSVCDA